MALKLQKLKKVSLKKPKKPKNLKAPELKPMKDVVQIKPKIEMSKISIARPTWKDSVA